MAETVVVREKLGRGRRTAVWVLILVASLLTLVMILTAWVDRQMLDNDSWRQASEDLITNEEVQNALSVFLVNQLYEKTDVPAALAKRLPENLKPIAPTLAGALRDPITRSIDALLSRPRLQLIFVEASTRAHQKLVNVLEDKTGSGISTGNGVVTLDLRQLVVEVGQSLGISQETLDRLPADAGVITVMRSDQLGGVQKIVKVIQKLSVWFVFIVVGLYALAVYLARGYRREVLRNVGISIAVVSLLALLIRRFVGNYAIDALTSPEWSGSVRGVWLIASSILGQIGRAGVIYGLITFLAAVLAGPTRAATWTRARIAPTLNQRPGVAWAVLAMVLLLLVVWGPTYALRTWWGILIFAVLFALGLLALRRETLEEFPSATPPAPAPEVPPAAAKPS